MIWWGSIVSEIFLKEVSSRLPLPPVARLPIETAITTIKPALLSSGNTMQNPLTMEIETRMGMIFLGLVSIFLAGVMLIAIKNYNSDQIVLDASITQVKAMSSTERQLIAAWLVENQITLPEGKGYNYVVQQYPGRPWLLQ
jgi:hypothetical protein